MWNKFCDVPVTKLLSGSDRKGKGYENNHGNPAVIFGLSAVLHIVAVVGLALLVGVNSTASQGLLLGLFVAIVWISTAIGVTYVFVGRTLRLFLIDAGFYVVFLALSGLILGVWH